MGPVVNWVSLMYLLSIASIHELRSISIDFELAFPQVGLYLVLLIVIVVVVNRVEWVLQLKNSFKVSIKWLQIGLRFLNRSLM